MSKLQLFKADEDLKPLVRSIGVGRDADLEKQLIKKSREPNILRFTPNDAARRFGDESMLEDWLSKGREIHWLIGEGDDLAGIIWYGKLAFPSKADSEEAPEYTFAIRLYQGYTGHHLSVPFMRQSVGIYARAKQEAGEPLTGLWLETDIDNPAALAAYTKFGYREVGRDDKRVTMVLDGARIKEYM
ncbi:MAG: hypothetical protein ACREJM_04770 [Candidatus Saccharimonadales bacterium]